MAPYIASLPLLASQFKLPARLSLMAVNLVVVSLSSALPQGHSHLLFRRLPQLPLPLHPPRQTFLSRLNYLAPLQQQAVLHHPEAKRRKGATIRDRISWTITSRNRKRRAENWTTRQVELPHRCHLPPKPEGHQWEGRPGLEAYLHPRRESEHLEMCILFIPALPVHHIKLSVWP